MNDLDTIIRDALLDDATEHRACPRPGTVLRPRFVTSADDAPASRATQHWPVPPR